MYSVRPVLRRASSRASFTRCASPPDRSWPTAQREITEADILQCSEPPGDLRKILDERQRLIDRQLEHLGNRLTAVFD